MQSRRFGQVVKLVPVQFEHPFELVWSLRSLCPKECFWEHAKEFLPCGPDSHAVDVFSCRVEGILLDKSSPMLRISVIIPY